MAPLVAAPRSPREGAQNDNVSLDELLDYADRNSPAMLAVTPQHALARGKRRAGCRGAEPLKTPDLSSVAVGPRFGATGTGVDVEAGAWQQLQSRRGAGPAGRKLPRAWGS